MISYAEIAAAVMWIALVVYALTGGADFGGGVWHLLATGPRAKRQRLLIDDAIAPIWEANHVWLILIVVLLFVCFPAAFAAASIALHIPLTLLLVGIVLRGAGFVFRHYAATRGMRRRWSRLFAAASAFAPFFLGVSLGAVTGGRIVIRTGTSVYGFVGPWLYAFPVSVGALAVIMFAFIAALYLLNETRDAELLADFRVRALAAGIALAVVAWIAIGLSPSPFRAKLLGEWWSWPLQIVTAIAAAGTFASLLLRRFSWARFLGVTQAILILAGWAVAQYPLLIAPRLSVEAASAPSSVIRLTLALLVAGSLLLAPSFYYLFRVFKGLRLSIGQPPDKE
jgi:cytochrome d ubiquinol oxidase subunit II